MKTKPITPQQAINNFKLFLELSPRNTYEQYRGAVRELAETVLDSGIQGDDQHPVKSPLLPALRTAERRLREGYSDQFTEASIEIMCPELKVVRDAIAKAKGQS